jgi:hypothetical protein
MYPQARTVWYRVLSKCVPTRKVIAGFVSTSSSICTLCHFEVDTLRHFLVDCPVKQI